MQLHNPLPPNRSPLPTTRCSGACSTSAGSCSPARSIRRSPSASARSSSCSSRTMPARRSRSTCTPRRRGRRRLRDLRHDAGAPMRRRDVCASASRRRWRSSCCVPARGQRFAHAHSRILMHQPLGAVEGYAVDVAIQAEQFSLARRMMAELTAQHTGQTVERILADGDRDRWFTADEALDVRHDRRSDRPREASGRCAPRASGRPCPREISRSRPPTARCVRTCGSRRRAAGSRSGGAGGVRRQSAHRGRRRPRPVPPHRRRDRLRRLRRRHRALHRHRQRRSNHRRHR